MEFRTDLENHVGPPIEVTDEMIQACREKGHFGSLLFDLYKEAGRLLTVTSSTYMGYPGEAIKLPRNQAICAGLLVRISKLMTSVVRLSSDIEHGETVQALNRCIIDSMISVRYLMLKDSDVLFDRFVKNGLRPERQLYDLIQENITNRGGAPLVIEESMLQSILDKCESSGVTIEEINVKAGSWGGSFQDRVKALGFGDEAYAILQGIPSHAIHGTWMDLLNNHLVRVEGGFAPNFDHTETDGELLMPVAFLVAEAAREYLDKYFGREMSESLYERLDSVQVRLMKVATATEDWQNAS